MMPSKKDENKISADEQRRRFEEAANQAELDKHGIDAAEKAFSEMARRAQEPGKSRKNSN